ncbi:MAG: hypothetical protein ACOYIT_07525 [Christensenellales bacterium]|jgi:hypothetical protein
MLKNKTIIAVIMCVVLGISFLVKAEDYTLLKTAEQGEILDVCLKEESMYLLTNLGVYEWKANGDSPERLIDLAVFQVLSTQVRNFQLRSPCYAAWFINELRPCSGKL